MSEIYERGEIVDVLRRHGQSIVLTATQCIRLSEVGTAAFAYLDRPRTSEELEAHLVRRFGTAPDGALENLLSSLVKAGLIIRRPDGPFG